MDQQQGAVLHFRDGQTLHCALRQLPDENSSVIHAVDPNGERNVELGDLKAVFFVRKSSTNEVEEEPADLRASLGVEFIDGEVIRGRAGQYNPASSGFYLFPADRSKNERIFVVSSAIVSIEAEKL